MRSILAGTVVWALWTVAVAQESKLPVPSDDAQGKAEKVVRDVFRAEYAVKTLAAQQTLAKKLLQQGSETKDDPVVRYVLFRESADLASRSGDLETMQASLDELCGRYSVDAPALRESTLIKAEPLLSKPEEFRKLAEAHLKVAGGALDLDQFDRASRSAQAALAAAKKAKALPLITRSDAMIKSATELKSGFERAKKAEQALAASPEDSNANLIWGEYLCLTRGRWEEGLARLAKSTDGPLKALALRELSSPGELAGLVQVADGWWDLSEKEKNVTRKGNLAAHARSFYERALPKAEGLLKLKVQQRMGPPAVQESAVSEGLVGQWLFNEGNGSQVADTSGKGNSGEAQGTLRWAAGVQGTAGDFDGNSFVSFGTRDLPPYGAPLTIAWAQFVRSATSTKTVLLSLDDADALISISIGYTQNGAFGVWKWHEEWLATAPATAVGEWHEFAYTFDGKTHRLYADGALASNTTVGLAPKVPFKRLEFGRWGGGGGSGAGHYLDGMLDDIRIFSRALSDAEVRKLQRNPK